MRYRNDAGTIPHMRSGEAHRAAPLLPYLDYEEVIMNERNVVPVWEKYALTVQEAAAYFRIGENKLRRIISEDKEADFILWNGNRPQIKRSKFESYLDKQNVI